MIHGSSLGREFAEAMADTLEVHAGIAAAWRHLAQFMDGRGYSVVLVGDPGTGKTRLLATVLNEVEKRWPFGHYVYWTMPEFADARRDAIRGDRSDPVEGCIHAHLCALDDLGAELVTEWGIEGLYRVIDERRKAARITLIGTNLLPYSADPRARTLATVYGDRIVSRLVGEHGTIARVAGPDRRLKQAMDPKPVEWTRAIIKPTPALAAAMHEELVRATESDQVANEGEPIMRDEGEG